MSTTIEDRVILLLRDKSGDTPLETSNESTPLEKIKSTLSGENRKRAGRYGFWETLDKYTSISAQRWRKAYTRRQRPTPDMIEALSKAFPEHAFWLATGITDATNGHIAPDTAQTFPERLNKESDTSSRYFQKSLELTNRLYKEGNVNLTDDKERMYASERTRPLAHWWDSALCESAYRIAASEEYLQIKQLWNEREEERKHYLHYITNNSNKPRPNEEHLEQSNSLESSTIFGSDPRIKHQGQWDLFYEPLKAERTKFALNIMNVEPSKLTDIEVAKISTLKYSDITAYLKHHKIDKHIIFPFNHGRIYIGEDGLTEEELERLEAVIQEKRQSQ